MHRILIAALALFAPTAGMLAPALASANLVRAAEDGARVPRQVNSSCPIMGKPISLALYTDTSRGRIWVCCKGCIAQIHDDVELAHRTAFPDERVIANTHCPVTGEELAKDAPTVLLQGLRFAVRDAVAAERAVADSQVVIARVLEPNLVVVGNTKCPIDGADVVDNAFVVVDDHIVRLSSERHVEAASKDPAATLARARELVRESK
jgi:hypothetical protein